jgi:hypothetical protein
MVPIDRTDWANLFDNFNLQLCSEAAEIQTLSAEA